MDTGQANKADVDPPCLIEPSRPVLFGRMIGLRDVITFQGGVREACIAAPDRHSGSDRSYDRYVLRFAVGAELE
jgi:hypothetical protein